MHADDFVWTLRRDGDIANRKRWSVGSEDTVFRNMLLNFFDDLVLNVYVLKHGLDNHIGGVEAFVRDGAGCVGRYGVSFELRQLLSFHCLNGKYLIST